jgi:AraC-like DNA-binding protein/mannose-6-phosphate isomerase-like protein (cupin superfamily)
MVYNSTNQSFWRIKMEKELKSVISYAGMHYTKKTTAKHLHHGTELVYIAKGKCSNHFQNRELSAEAGDAIIIPSEQIHRQFNFGKVQSFFVVFELESSEFKSDLRVIDTNGSNFINVWMEQLVQLYQSRLLNECNYLLRLILTHLKSIEHDFYDTSAMPPAIKKAINFIDFRFHNEILVQDVARHIGLSCSYFNRLFNRHMKISPSEYLSNVRMGHARQLLRNSRLSIAEVGFQCGYVNDHYFCRVFRKVHRCTPREYRDNPISALDNYNIHT